MKKRSRKSYILPALIAVLMLLSFVTGVLASGLLLKVGDETPKTEFNVNIPKSAAPRRVTPKLAPARVVRLDNTDPGSDVTDSEGQWGEDATVSLFRAEYRNEDGQITVKSPYGEKVIAPGTSNIYYFDIKNTGGTGIDYHVETQVRLTFISGGQEYEIPLEARFYTSDGRYIAGSETTFLPMRAMDGVQDTGDIAMGNYIRYVLEWQWPFEGDDELDTLLGNLAGEGDTIDVSIFFQVTASENDNAQGGLPDTGDSSNIPLVMGIGVFSLVMAVILLFMRRKEEDEQEA